MKVLQGNAGLLLNFAALDLLHSGGPDKRPPRTLLPLDLMMHEYVVPTPTGTHNSESLGKLLTDAEPLNLTAADKPKALNGQPTTEVEVHVVDNCIKRLSRESSASSSSLLWSEHFPGLQRSRVMDAEDEELAQLGDGSDDMEPSWECFLE